MIGMERDVLAHQSSLRPGTRVEVATRFRGNWVTGFEVASAGDLGYRVRRTSDGAVLPVEFSYASVRPAGD
jgi:hypothetical protein